MIKELSRFGRLHVLKPLKRDDSRYLCRCSCGIADCLETVVVFEKELDSGMVKSCIDAKRVSRRSKKKKYTKSNSIKSGYPSLFVDFLVSLTHQGRQVLVKEKEYKQLAQQNCCKCGAAPTVHPNHGVKANFVRPSGDEDKVTVATVEVVCPDCR